LEALSEIADQQGAARRALPTLCGPESLPPPYDVLPVRLRDGEIVTARRHGNPAGPRLFVSHGNGLAADLYFPFWRHFLTDYDVVLYDLRNHGWNAVGEWDRHHFAAFVFDNESVLEAVGKRWGPRPALGAFHSLSALVALYQVLRAGPRWAGLVLFDPPITPPLGHRLEPAFRAGQIAISERAARRSESYPDYEAFASVLGHARGFSHLSAPVRRLIARATLRPWDAPAPGVVLRCPRELEARVYVANLDSTIELAMPGFPCPLEVIGADPSAPAGGAPSRICESLLPAWGVEYESVAGTTHFLQLEKPVECARLAREFFRRCGLGP